MDRLKPCPFCGSKDIKLFGNHRDSFWFRCNKCASIDSYDTERQAVRAWNKRVAIPSAEPRYCDRNICLRNEYNGIGCDECEVTKSQEPKTGHWIEQIDHEENCRTLICSNCDRPALHDGDSIWKHKFCPHCGARMVEPQESEG